MSRTKDLLKNTSILMVAKISTQVVSFLLLPLYTALLTTVEYGRVDVYTSLAMIIIPFMTLQVEMALFCFFITEKDLNSQKEIVSCSGFIVGIMTGILSILYFILSGVFDFPYGGLLYGYYISQMVATFLLQVCRAQGDNVGYGIASFISSALAVILNVLFIAVLRWSVEGILVSSIIAQSVSCGFMLLRTKISYFISIKFIRKERCKLLLQYAVPLVFNQIASWAINYSDRLIIVIKWGEWTNGIYSVASKFSNIINTFFNIYNVAWTENVVRSIKDEDGPIYISKIFELTFNAYLILVTGIINLLPFIFHILINKSFLSAYQHVPFLLVAMLFSGMAATLGSIYIAYSHTKEVSLTTMLAGVCNIIVHFVLLESCRLYAASISTLVSFGALFIYRYIFIQKIFTIKFNIKKILPQLIVLVFAWIAYALQNSNLILMGLLANLGCVGLLLKNNWYLLKKFINKNTNPPI